MPHKQKADKSWSLINFYKNPTKASKSQISIDSVSDASNFDDILSNTSSDESDLPVNPPEENDVDFSLDTLTRSGSTDTASDIDRTFEDDSSGFFCSRRFVRAFGTISDIVANLRTWQVILLTSFTTLLATHLVQSYYYGSMVASNAPGANAPLVTSDGIIYNGIEFRVPFGYDTPPSKFYVDFESRTAYPITSEISTWDAYKFELSKYVGFMWAGMKQFNVKDIFDRATTTVNKNFDAARWSVAPIIKRSFQNTVWKFRSVSQKTTVIIKALSSRTVATYGTVCELCTPLVRSTTDFYSSFEKKTIITYEKIISARDSVFQKARNISAKHFFQKCSGLFAGGADNISNKWRRTLLMLKFKNER